MKQIYWNTSQNGRWGISIVSETLYQEADVRLTSGKTLQATISYLGITEGHRVYRLEKTDKQQWAVIFGDAVALAGASVVYSESLQGGACCSLLLLSEQAIVKTYGYKRRSSQIHYYEQGQEKNIPASVLLALGLLPDTPEPEEVPPPPTFDPAGMEPQAKGALAEALRKAGLA